MDLLPKSGLSVPQIKYTPVSVIGNIRAGKKATIVKITLEEGKDWDESLSVSRVGLAHALRNDTAQTIATIFGVEYWNAYKDSILNNQALQQPHRMFWAWSAGDMLFWRMVSQIYIDAMENETNELKMMVLAKKAQIAFQHSEMTLAVLKDAMPCVVSIISV